MAIGRTTATAQASPEVARRAWPRWLALGLALVAVAVAAVVESAAGARLLLGAVGLLAAVRGAVLLAGPRRGRLDEHARGLGTGAAVAGVASLAVAAGSASLAGWVLLAAAPLGLLAGSLALAARGGVAGRGGRVALGWSALVTALLLVTGLAAGWDRARGGATVLAALAVGAGGVALLVGSAGLRAAAARPAPARRAAGCAGCACAGGGCGVPG